MGWPLAVAMLWTAAPSAAIERSFEHEKTHDSPGSSLSLAFVSPALWPEATTAVTGEHRSSLTWTDVIPSASWVVTTYL